MTTSSLVLYFLIFVLLYLTYSAFTLKNKIWCSFRRRDKSKIEKWANVSKKGKWKDIEFDGGLYHVESARTVLQWKNYLGFFPMPIRCLDFRWDSSRALHPDTFDNTFTPEEREQLDISDDVRQFGEGNERTLIGKQKQGMLEKLMPIIMIGGFVILGYFIYTINNHVNLVGNGQNFIEQQLAEIKAALGK